MKKEQTKQLPGLDPATIKKMESQKYVSQNQEDVANDEIMTYEWIEDNVIQKKATVEFTRNSEGKEVANVKMISTKTGKEELVYYTENKVEVGRLKAVTEGKTITVEVPEKQKGKF